MKSDPASNIFVYTGASKLQKAAVPQSTSPAQRPFRFWLRLIASVHRRPTGRSFLQCRRGSYSNLFQRSYVCFHDSWYRPPEELCLFVFGRRGLWYLPDLPVSPQVPVQICCVSKSSPLKSLFIMRSGKVIFFAHFLLTCSVPCDIFIIQGVRNFSPHFIVWYIFIHKKGTFL